MKIVCTCPVCGESFLEAAYQEHRCQPRNRRSKKSRHKTCGGAPKATEHGLSQKAADILSYLAYDYQLTGHVRFRTRLNTLAKQIKTASGSNKWKTGSQDGKVEIIDLHGLGRMEAHNVLTQLTSPIAVVFWGKGDGIMRQAALDFMGTSNNYSLVGESGGSKERPQSSVGMFVGNSFWYLLSNDEEDRQNNDEIVDPARLQDLPKSAKKHKHTIERKPQRISVLSTPSQRSSLMRIMGNHASITEQFTERYQTIEYARVFDFPTSLNISFCLKGLSAPGASLELSLLENGREVSKKCCTAVDPRASFVSNIAAGRCVFRVNKLGCGTKFSADFVLHTNADPIVASHGVALKTSPRQLPPKHIAENLQQPIGRVHSGEAVSRSYIGDVSSRAPNNSRPASSGSRGIVDSCIEGCSAGCLILVIALILATIAVCVMTLQH